VLSAEALPKATRRKAPTTASEGHHWSGPARSPPLVPPGTPDGLPKLPLREARQPGQPVIGGWFPWQANTDSARKCILPKPSGCAHFISRDWNPKTRVVTSLRPFQRPLASSSYCVPEPGCTMGDIGQRRQVAPLMGHRYTPRTERVLVEMAPGERRPSIFSVSYKGKE